MPKNLHQLSTEQINAQNQDLDLWSPLEIVTRMNAEDRLVIAAVESQLPQIASAVELIVARLAAGGRLFYVGAGTSGRLSVLDASECPPTFGVPPTLVQGIIAGGRAAIVRSSEGIEDDPKAGAADVRKRKVGARDVVVGIAASGRTPYVVGALQQARSVGAATIALVNALPSPIAQLADIVIAPVTGPEIVSGSTRLKAGTAQKLVLNMLSTATFIQLGKVYRNLMVDVQASNAKLRARAIRILVQATGIEEAKAKRLLPRVHWEVKTAIVMQLAGVTADEARGRLKAAKGFVRSALPRPEAS